jgi:peptidoglycan/LPS O-acetylase OafA/YrhL
MRIQGLDFLRAISIIGVLFRHSHFPQDWLAVKAGWAGVDLFFVLSGFLVSRLLFREFQQRGRVDIGRFLIRRGFKIYPSFYLFLLLGGAYWVWLLKAPMEGANLLAEFFFLQSYVPNVWGHSWSLAVEEHFYLALALVFGLLGRAGLLGRRWLLLGLWLGLWGLAFWLRYDYVHARREAGVFIFFASHLRMEGLIAGLTLSHVFHSFEAVPAFLRRWRLPFLLLGLAGALPPFLLTGGSYWISAYGYSLMSLGFACLTGLAAAGALELPSGARLLQFIWKALIFIGLHSYTLYLWHLFARSVADRLPWGLAGQELVYFGGSLLLGIGAALLVEKPLLRFRDQWFPA